MQGTSTALALSAPREPDRDELIRLSAPSHRSLRLSALWGELRSGRLRILETFRHEDQLFLISERAARTPDMPIDERNVRALERALLGVSLKCIAYELGVAHSTVALEISSALKAMGLSCGVRGTPLFLAMAAEDYWNSLSLPSAWLTVLGRIEVVRTRSPDSCLEASLSQAELAVTRLRLDGISHGEIAARRAATQRTVANQLSTAYRKLRVSGRGDLIRHIIHAYAERCASTRDAERPLAKTEAH